MSAGAKPKSSRVKVRDIVGDCGHRDCGRYRSGFLTCAAPAFKAKRIVNRSRLRLRVGECGSGLHRLVSDIRINRPITVRRGDILDRRGRKRLRRKAPPRRHRSG